MKLSTDRILTTHVGSLPRPDDLFEMMLARMDGKPVDDKAYKAALDRIPEPKKPYDPWGVARPSEPEKTGK